MKRDYQHKTINATNVVYLHKRGFLLPHKLKITFKLNFDKLQCCVVLPGVCLYTVITGTFFNDIFFCT